MNPTKQLWNIVSFASRWAENAATLRTELSFSSTFMNKGYLHELPAEANGGVGHQFREHRQVSSVGKKRRKR